MIFGKLSNIIFTDESFFSVRNNNFFIWYYDKSQKKYSAWFLVFHSSIFYLIYQENLEFHEPDKAIDYLKTCLERSKNHPAYLHELGTLIVFCKGDLKEAL